MEKNKLFDVSLDSLIEVDAQGDSNYPTELLSVPRPSDIKEKEEKEEKNEEEGLIDLEENIDGNEEEIEDEVEDEET